MVNYGGENWVTTYFKIGLPRTYKYNRNSIEITGASRINTKLASKSNQ